jgi:type IX secretion system PorP/SprF family membrane protein
MKKIVLILIILSVTGKWLAAQDEHIYSQYLFHPILMNPAYSGFNADHEILFNYKNNYATFPGAPKNYTASFHGPVAPKLGFGALLFNDVAGDLSKFKAQGSLAYKFIMGSVKLNAGIAAQFSRLQLSNGVLFDPSIDPSDPIFATYADGLNFFSSTLGLYGEQDGKLKFGISVVDLARTRIDEIQSPVPNENTFFKYFNAFVGYKYDVKNYNFTVEPSVLVKRLRNVPFQTDLNLKMTFLDEQLFGAVSYSIGGFSKTAFMLGTRINKFKIFYSYDIAIEDFQKYNNGGHELSLSFNIASKYGTN